MNSYRVSITCPTSAERAYRAVSEEMSAWWTPMSDTFTQPGDRAKTGFGGKAYWVFEAKTLKPPRLIELACVEANYLHPEMTEAMREEWLGTTLRFAFEETNGNTTVTFTHDGLLPEMGCYEVCKGGWDHYILESLNDHLSGRGGKPNTY